MKKIQSIIVIILFLSINNLSAQPHFFHKNREKIKEKKLEFIKEKLQLTAKEEKAFLPVYKVFETKRENLHMKKRGIMMKYKKNFLNLSDAEITKMSDSFIEIDYQMALIGKEYHEKFKKVIPVRKVLILYKSEFEFKKQLIRKMKRKHRKFDK